jgi:putative membrane protein insertion efficiency factor
LVETFSVWPRDAASAAIRAYQRFVSPLLPPSCRFTPSCSQYALVAIEKHGLLRGMLMGTMRVLRCNPFSKGGFDPVR